MISMTHMQAQALDFIARFTRENDGVGPSFQELSDELGLKSKSGAYRLVEALVERGRLTRLPNRARTLRVVPENLFDGIPSHLLVAELARRGELASERRHAA